MDNMTISLGTEQETDELSDQLFAFNKGIVPDFVGRESPSDIVRYVLKKDNELVAGITGRITLNNVVYVDNLFVKEEFRGQGCASFLLDKVESEAKSRGCYLAYLDTINIEAVDLYKKHGYEVFASIENVPCPGVTVFYMKKNY